MNPHFKGTPLFDIEYIINDTGQTRGFCKPLVESNMWHTELCHRRDLDRPQGRFVDLIRYAYMSFSVQKIHFGTYRFRYMVQLFVAARLQPSRAAARLQARPMASCGVFPSVIVYVTFVYCVETSKHIPKLFYRRVATPF